MRPYPSSALPGAWVPGCPPSWPPPRSWHRHRQRGLAGVGGGRVTAALHRAGQSRPRAAAHGRRSDARRGARHTRCSRARAVHFQPGSRRFAPTPRPIMWRICAARFAPGMVEPEAGPRRRGYGHERARRQNRRRAVQPRRTRQLLRSAVSLQPLPRPSDSRPAATLPRPACALYRLAPRPAARAIYARIGGRSPLLAGTEAQASAPEAELGGPESCKVFVAMRYSAPFVDDAARAVAAYAPDSIALLPLYPQFSTTTTGSSMTAWRQAAEWAGITAPSYGVCCYPTDQTWISAQAELIGGRSSKRGPQSRRAFSSRPMACPLRWWRGAIPTRGRWSAPPRRLPRCSRPEGRAGRFGGLLSEPRRAARLDRTQHRG